ncbi:MAG: glycosyltransferase, partial [Acidimicrobiia bacterium]|nr:glycosyltransferase [Acidimicrobiia bacterium]
MPTPHPDCWPPSAPTPTREHSPISATRSAPSPRCAPRPLPRPTDSPTNSSPVRGREWPNGTPPPSCWNSSRTERTLCQTPRVTAPEPLVTVAVSTHAAERRLGRCLDMLLAQTIGDRLEVIVIDSGSPEDERSVVEPFLATGRVHYVRTERENLYAAWGRALARARGRYFANVNTDDWVAPHSLATLAEALDTHAECALAYADWAVTDVPQSAPGPESTVCSHARWVPALHLFYCYTGCVQFWRRSALEALGGHDPALRYCGDLEVLRRLTEAGMRAVYVPEVLWGFFRNPDGLSMSTDGSIDEQREVHRRARQAVRIEQLFAVDPDDARAAADAWTALGVFAMRVRVPWING